VSFLNGKDLRRKYWCLLDNDTLNRFGHSSVLSSHLETVWCHCIARRSPTRVLELWHGRLLGIALNSCSCVVPHYFVLKSMGDVAAINPMEVVPNLKEVMARTLPILGNIKKDNMRWVFAAGMFGSRSCSAWFQAILMMMTHHRLHLAFGHWCDAVLSYLANLDKATDKAISLETFSSEVFPAYEIMFGSWLSSSESKVRLATVQAIGNMCAVMPHEQFETQLPRIIPGVLALYKKEKNHLPITQALSMVLSVGVNNNSQVMEPQMTNVLNTIHPLACTPGIFEQPDQIKNANELLRCFEIIGMAPSNLCKASLFAALRTDRRCLPRATVAWPSLFVMRTTHRPSLSRHVGVVFVGTIGHCQTKECHDSFGNHQRHSPFGDSIGYCTCLPV
jgi:hypothetical protein